MIRQSQARSAALAALVALSVLAGSIAFAGTAAAAASGTADTDPADPGANATHTMSVDVTPNEAGNSLSTVYINYSADTAFDGDVANVTTRDVLRVGVDMDEDGDIDRKAKDLKNVLHPRNGTVVFDFGGDTDIDHNESVVVTYENVTNPTTGSYNVSLDVNHQSKFDPVNATLTTGPNVTDYENETTTVTSYEPASNHNEIIDSAPPKPGATATHHVAIATSSNEVGNSLSDVQVNYHADGSFDGSVQDVGVDDVKKVGFDVDGDGDIEVSTMDDLKKASTSNVGETVTFDFGGNYGIKDDYTVIVVYGDAANPNDAGNYTVEADLNVQSTQNPRTGSLVLANFTFHNTSIQNYTATNGTYTNTTVLNGTWSNVTVANSTWTNVTQNRTVLANTSVLNSTLTNTTFTNATWTNTTWTNVSVVNSTWTNSTAVNATWTNTSALNTTWANTSFANASFQNVTFQNVTLQNVTFQNVTWRNLTVTDTTLTNVTVTDATWANSTMTDSAFQNVTESGVDHRNVTLENLFVENESLADATLEDHKYKHEEKYVRETLDDNENKDR